MPIESTDTGPQQPAQGVRDQGVSLIAAYHFLVAGLFLMGTVTMSFPTLILGAVGILEDPGAFIGMLAVGMIALVTMIFCLVHLVVGYGLWTQRAWGRVAAMALAVVTLFAVPIGAIVGGAILWYLLKPEVAAHFETATGAA
jgi:hypothetical protein